MQEVSAFVLAGGRSVRMGCDKAFMRFRGRTLLQQALARARAVSPAVFIVGGRQKFAGLGPVVEDVFVGHGPLGGIHAALRASPADLNLILAVDMPFVEAGLLGYLLRRAREHPSAVVTAPRSNDGWQPLCAVYRTSFADVAEPALREGQNKIDRLFAAVEVCPVWEDELARFGWGSCQFRNLNTPKEVEAARR